jgi:hypothetical protein
MRRPVKPHERAIVRLLDLDRNKPNYFTELILLARQMIDYEEEEELRAMLFEVQRKVLETKIVPAEDRFGNTVWVERLSGPQTFYDIDMAMGQNDDCYAYFEKEDGTKVSRFEIERDMEDIRRWVYGKVRKRAMAMRFSIIK